MARKFKERPASVLENIVKESLDIMDIEMGTDKIRLLLRLIVSGIAKHYFISPDDIIKVGFLQFEKSPDKDELFKVTLLRDKNAGVINADTLWKYYKGELKQEAQFKEILEGFLEELINYSQEQEIEIMNITNSIEEKKRRTNYGI